MSEEETGPTKPLHVQVAEALGCKPAIYWENSPWECRCEDSPHAAHTIHSECCHSHSGMACNDGDLAAYDTDWAATGPLIEKYGLRVYPHQGMDAHGDGGWNASRGSWADFHVGATPLVAVCNLILALAKAGKLQR